ncbi:MAG: hypothetical protein BWY86_00958 [Candidatus Aminicenantes bacterium ADurb.Bin508]|nr:MAG: hypothetical protein BWY86_00958 [Candidatus Aminicenantes bacterium ADurb.Bin508]
MVRSTWARGGPFDPREGCAIIKAISEKREGNHGIHRHHQRSEHRRRVSIRSPMRPLRSRLPDRIQGVHGRPSLGSPGRGQQPLRRTFRKRRRSERKDRIRCLEEGSRLGLQGGPSGAKTQLRSMPPLFDLGVPRPLLEHQEGSLQRVCSRFRRRDGRGPILPFGGGGLGTRGHG